MKLSEEDILSKLKIDEKINMTNIVLFDSKGKIRKYESVNQII